METNTPGRLPGGKWALIGIVLVVTGGFLTYVYLDVNGVLSRKNFLTIATPANVRSFQITDQSGAVIWRVASPAPVALSRVSYGTVPPGFVQEVPPRGTRPRALTAGETLDTETITAERRFTHNGQAWGTDGFRGGAWQSESPKRP